MSGRRRRSGAVLKGLVAAGLASAVGVVLNLATEWKDNPLAWALVVVLTAAAGVIAGLLDQEGAAAEPPGPVLQFEIEMRPDGTHILRTTIYSEEMARELGRPVDGG